MPLQGFLAFFAFSSYICTTVDLEVSQFESSSEFRHLTESIAKLKSQSRPSVPSNISSSLVPVVYKYLNSQSSVKASLQTLSLLSKHLHDTSLLPALSRPSPAAFFSRLSVFARLSAVEVTEIRSSFKALTDVFADHRTVLAEASPEALQTLKAEISREVGNFRLKLSAAASAGLRGDSDLQRRAKQTVKEIEKEEKTLNLALEEFLREAGVFSEEDDSSSEISATIRGAQKAETEKNGRTVGLVVGVVVATMVVAAGGIFFFWDKINSCINSFV